MFTGIARLADFDQAGRRDFAVLFGSGSFTRTARMDLIFNWPSFWVPLHRRRTYDFASVCLAGGANLYAGAAHAAAQV
jgi:hypothetical protein